MITIVILIMIILIILLYLVKKERENMIYVKSDIDGEEYLVRDEEDKKHAANMLSRMKQNLYKLTDYLYENREKYKDKKQYIERLNKKMRKIVIIESTKDSIYTSYSINKGEQIVFCIRSRKTEDEMHDINLMMYVALHEISHVACPVYDNHGPLFREIFNFITKVAIEINIYEKIDFKKQPMEYCGMTISDSII